VNAELTPAVPLSVTVVPMGKFAEQMVPQLIPAGVLVTVPMPVPVLMIVRTGDVKSNATVTVRDAFIGTMQSRVPLHSPPQPAKVLFAFGYAPSKTALLDKKRMTQSPAEQRGFIILILG